jgi:tryptophan synthase alpha chain
MTRTDVDGVSELERALVARRASGLPALIPYVTAGDPSLEITRGILEALDAAGVDAIEVGVPFSDPIADGPVIQAAAQRALTTGTTLPAILDLLTSMKGGRRAPLVLFSYVNPILRMGERAFAARAAEAGVSGVLLTDAVPGAAPALEEALAAEGLDVIVLVSPTTPDERVLWLAARARGFLYLIARRGVTGQGGEDADLSGRMALIRSASDVPVQVGFGVRTGEDARRIGAWADGVIVGSALVELLHAEQDVMRRPALAGEWARSLLGEMGRRDG